MEASLSALSRINSAEAAGVEVSMDVLRIRPPQARTKAMFVFGEHARELITGEAALGLARALCGKGGSRRTAAATKALAAVEFVLVPNANPLGRKVVEAGYYCKRTNEDGVDLNRNWSEEHRDTSQAAGDEMYPGPSGFSEPETQLLRDLVDNERPDIYLSVHSGAYLLGTPYGYEDSTPVDEAAMLQVLRPISQHFCGGRCPVGNLAGLIHYQNPGCDIDYVYDRLRTPFVFTWEIFVGEEFRGRYLEEAQMQEHEAQLNPEEPSLAQVRLKGRRRHLRAQRPEAAEDLGSCLEQFNPRSEEETAQVVETWSGAFLELCELVSATRTGADGTKN